MTDRDDTSIGTLDSHMRTGTLDSRATNDTRHSRPNTEVRIRTSA